MFTDKKSLTERLTILKTRSLDGFMNMFPDKNIIVSVENYKNKVQKAPLWYILDNTLQHMLLCYGGCIYTWIHANMQCYAMLTINGCWELYTLAPKRLLIDTTKFKCVHTEVGIINWDDDSYMYAVLLNEKTNIPLPKERNEFGDEHPSGCTFKDLSYVVLYVNSFIRGLVESY